MVTYRFLFNANQVKTLNSIVVGIVEITLKTSVVYVPGYLISKSLGFLIVFKADNKVRTVLVQAPTLLETSRLLSSGDKNIGIIGFNLGAYPDACDFYNHTGLLFPKCPSKLYSDSRADTGISNEVPSGTTQFNLKDLLVNQVENSSKIDLDFFQVKIDETLNIDVEVLGAYVLNMLQYAWNIYLCAKNPRGNSMDIVVRKINKTYKEFSIYLDSLNVEQKTISEIKIVEQEQQKLLAPGLDNDTNTNTNINKTMTNSTFVFAYNVKDINKTDNIVKGALTLPAEFVKQNASVIPACIWTFGKNKCIQFEYMGNVRIVKVDSNNPNALIKNVAKGQAPIFQLVFSLDMSSKKELRAKEVGVLPVVYYSANQPEGAKTEVSVREFSSEQFETKKISLENILSVYSPILERDFFINACSIAKQAKVEETVVIAETYETPLVSKPSVVAINVVGDSIKSTIVNPLAMASVKVAPTKVVTSQETTASKEVVVIEETKIEVVSTADEKAAQKAAKKQAYLKARKETRDAKKAAAKLAKQIALTEEVKVEAQETLEVVADDQEQSKETVIVDTINTNTKETKTMNYQTIFAMNQKDQIAAMSSFTLEQVEAFLAYSQTDEAIKEYAASSQKSSAPVLNTNKNIEVKPMSGAPESKSIAAARAAQQAAQQEEAPAKSASKFERSAAPMTAEDEDAYYAALDAQEDNTVAAANGQEKSEEIAQKSTNTNPIPNNKTMDNAKSSSRKLVSIELVVNIIAAIGGDCARKNHSISKRTEKLNVLRNKNSKTISNVRGYGAIRTNSNDGSCFLDVNVFPETAMTVYNTNNRPVIIFHYDDNTQAIQSEANTEKFWRKVLHVSEETVIPNINPTLKVDLPANADTLCERIDAGTVQAVSIKFTNMDKKMFTYYSSDVSGRFIVYLKAAGDYDVSLLRDTVEVSDNFLNYNGEKGAVNNFAGASKTGRSGNSAVVVARPQVAAAQSNLYGMPSTVEVSKVVETVAPVAVVIDTEKEALRAENVALKAEVSELKTQIAELTASQARMEAKLTAGQARMEALMEQLVAAQAVKTEEVSIPEISEIVAPAFPAEVVETEEQQLARLEEERMNFFRACEFDNYEATGEETLDFDQRAELNKLDEEIKTLKWLMNIPVADRAAAIEARRLEKEEAIRKSTEALANINKPGADLSGLFN